MDAEDKLPSQSLIVHIVFCHKEHLSLEKTTVWKRNNKTNARLFQRASNNLCCYPCNMFTANRLILASAVTSAIDSEKGKQGDPLRQLCVSAAQTTELSYSLDWPISHYNMINLFVERHEIVTILAERNRSL